MPDVVTAESFVTDAQTILRLLAYGVIAVGPDWRVIYANPEGERMIGSKGATLWDRCPDLEHTAFASGFRYAMKDRTELLSESALPSVGWCQARARPTPDGGLLISLRQVHAHAIESGQAKQALVIGEIGDALTREDSLRAALNRCALAMVRQLDCVLARIWTLDPDAGVLEMCGTAGVQIDDLQRIELGEHKLGEIAETLEPYLTNDVETDTQINAQPWVRREQIVSFAGYPLRIEDRVVGVMALYSRRLIDHDMLNALSSIADSLALGIDRKRAELARRRAEETARKAANDLALLHSLGQELVAELDLEMLAQRVVDAATKLCRAQIGVFFYTMPHRAMEYAVSGVARGALASFEVPRSTSLLGPAFIDRKTIVIDDITKHPEHTKAAPTFALPEGHPAMKSYLAVPVVGREGRRIGALLFGHEWPSAFSDSSQKLLEGVAAHAAIAMDNARLFTEATQMITALEKSNKELDQFAYIASHDLKAPLRGIANLATWIEDDLEGKLDDQTREHIHLLRGRVTRLENLIAGILAYSRAGKDRTEASRVDVGALVNECWELLAAPETVAFRIVGPMPTVVASRPQLQQVFMNLMGNAVKYNRERALAIEVGVSSHKGRFYEFFVRDNGIGIAPEFHEKIWGLFQTLERRDKVESTGIGLSIVRKIVESQGGTARVESAPGEGATFTFTWPAEQMEERK